MYQADIFGSILQSFPSASTENILLSPREDLLFVFGPLCGALGKNPLLAFFFPLPLESSPLSMIEVTRSIDTVIDSFCGDFGDRKGEKIHC